jgi:hypothetical protein
MLTVLLKLIEGTKTFKINTNFMNKKKKSKVQLMISFVGDGCSIPIPTPRDAKSSLLILAWMETRNQK